MAVNKHVNVRISAHEGIVIHFEDHALHLSCAELPLRVQRIKQHYADYQQSQCDINHLFEHPSELLLLILDHYDIAPGLRLNLSSELPIGCGMGTSAAVILACFTALNDYFKVSMSQDDLYQRALAIENFQHGKSSGLDISMSQRGGALFIEQGHRYPLDINIQPFLAINTGKPSVTTGECVESVKRYQHDTALWQAFGETTYAMKQALEEHNFQLLNDALKANHRLLSRIGVVPEKIQAFIKHIESLGCAGKISGAGSIQGDAGGMVIVLANEMTALRTACEAFDYALSPITGEPLGARTY